MQALERLLSNDFSLRERKINSRVFVLKKEIAFLEKWFDQIQQKGIIDSESAKNAKVTQKLKEELALLEAELVALKETPVSREESLLKESKTHRVRSFSPRRAITSLIPMKNEKMARVKVDSGKFGGSMVQSNIPSVILSPRDQKQKETGQKMEEKPRTTMLTLDIWNQTANESGSEKEMMESTLWNQSINLGSAKRNNSPRTVLYRMRSQTRNEIEEQPVIAVAQKRFQTSYQCKIKLWTMETDDSVVEFGEEIVQDESFKEWFRTDSSFLPNFSYPTCYLEMQNRKLLPHRLSSLEENRLPSVRTPSPFSRASHKSKTAIFGSIPPRMAPFISSYKTQAIDKLSGSKLIKAAKAPPKPVKVSKPSPPRHVPRIWPQFQDTSHSIRKKAPETRSKPPRKPLPDKFLIFKEGDFIETKALKKLRKHHLFYSNVNPLLKRLKNVLGLFTKALPDLEIDIMTVFDLVDQQQGKKSTDLELLSSVIGNPNLAQTLIAIFHQENREKQATKIARWYRKLVTMRKFHEVIRKIKKIQKMVRRIQKKKKKTMEVDEKHKDEVMSQLSLFSLLIANWPKDESKLFILHISSFSTRNPLGHKERPGALEEKENTQIMRVIESALLFPKTPIVFATHLNPDSSAIQFYYQLASTLKIPFFKERVRFIIPDFEILCKKTLSLSASILLSPKTMEALSKIQKDLGINAGFIISYLSGVNDVLVANKLKLPLMNGSPEKSNLFSEKFYSKLVFGESRVNCLFASDIIYGRKKLIAELRFVFFDSRASHKTQFILKGNESSKVNCIAIISIPEECRKLKEKGEFEDFIDKRLDKLVTIKGPQKKTDKETISNFFRLFFRQGGIIEEFITPDNKTKLRCFIIAFFIKPSQWNAKKPPMAVAFTEKITNSNFETTAYLFGDMDGRERHLKSEAIKIAQALQRKGVLGYLSIEFMILEDLYTTFLETSSSKHSRIWAMDISCRYPDFLAAFKIQDQILTDDRIRNVVYFPEIKLGKSFKDVDEQLSYFKSVKGPLSFDMRTYKGMMFLPCGSNKMMSLLIFLTEDSGILTSLTLLASELNSIIQIKSESEHLEQYRKKKVAKKIGKLLEVLDPSKKKIMTI